jgi:hypothetical protein
MSQQNERARETERLLQSLLDGSPDSTLLAPGFEYQQHFGSTAGVYVGKRGLRAWIDAFYDVWNQASMAVDDVREADDRSAMDVRVLVRGGKTGIEVELRATHIVRFSEDGRIARLDAFNEVGAAEALLRGYLRSAE